MNIVHIVHRDKFTTGYINFMKMIMTEFQHYFILSREGFPLLLKDMNNIYYVDNYSQAYKEKNIIKFLELSDIVIATGIFDSLDMLLALPVKIQKKLYLHFWGGDFYTLAEKKNILHIRWQKIKYKRLKCYARCSGFIFLIHGEYEKFKELTKIEKPYYIAPMPSNPDRNFNIADYRNIEADSNIIKVIIGNSATETNQHFEILEWMAAYKNKKIRVYLPLSYGDELYRKRIIEYGKNLLGKYFIPITNYMDEKSYIKFISSMNIGIFNNNRQQGMGNIQMLLGLGKKVYLREDTSMWNRYLKDGYEIFPIKNIQNISYEEFIKFNGEERLKNIKLYDDKENLQNEERAWKTVFDSIRGGRVERSY